MTAKIQGNMIGEIDVKRFYLPGIELHAECHGCGEVLETDFDIEYLGYPPVGKPFKHEMWCEHCDVETTVMLKLNVQLRVIQ